MHRSEWLSKVTAVVAISTALGACGAPPTPDSGAADSASSDSANNDSAARPDVAAQPDATTMDVGCPSGQQMCGAQCTDTQTSAAHCGACGNACAMGQSCVAGACRIDCAAPRVRCGAGAMMTCVDTQTDTANCGACGTPCTAANATAACRAGACAIAMCDANFGDCDMNAANGCETDTRSSPMNCGACGTACAAGQMCVAGRCQIDCPLPNTRCMTGAMMTCVDASRDVQHCGMCNNACPAPANATAACAMGSCGLGACAVGFGNCDANASNGCETNTTTVTNCGACNNACVARPNATAACMTGACRYTCNTGFSDCDGNASNGCETNTNTSNAHCGGCGMACSSGQTCSAGRCVATCPAHSVCRTGMPDPATVFNAPEQCYSYPNNLVNSFWHRTRNQIYTGHYSMNGFWAHAPGASGYPTTTNNQTSETFHRMVLVPATSTVITTNQAQFASDAARIFVRTLDVATGAMSPAVAAVFSNGFTGRCNLLSSTATEFLCYTGAQVDVYTTTAGSARLTFSRSVVFGATRPTLCDTYCFGGTFAADGVYLYFPTVGNSAANTEYDVFNATSGASVGRFTAVGGAAVSGLYFDWSIGRYATHDGFGGRRGAANFTAVGMTFSDDSQCYGPVSPYHAP